MAENELEVPEVLAKDVRYFSSVRNYTLALLNAFNGVELYVNQENSDLDKVFTVPITFNNYEKSILLEDISEDQITKGNFNFLPRLVLGFEGMTKAPERQTNKFQKLSKKIYLQDDPNVKMNVAYNSLAYDFHFTLLIQARGLTQISQLVEEILVYFNPTLNLNILECPIFNDKTETQIQISDPAWELNDEFTEEQVNINSVTFDVTVRGNIYSPLQLTAPIKTIKLFTHVWDTVDYKDSKLSSYYKFTKVDDDEGLEITQRIFNGTIPWAKEVEYLDENLVIQKRPDYKPYEVILRANPYATDIFDTTRYVDSDWSVQGATYIPAVEIEGATFTYELQDQYDEAYIHSQSLHAPVDAEHNHPDTALTSINNTFTKAQIGSVEVLTYSTTTTIDLSLSNRFTVTLTGDIIIDSSSAVQGQGGLIYIEQDAVGNHTAMWDSEFIFFDEPSEETSADMVNMYAYEVYSKDKIIVSYLGVF